MRCLLLCLSLLAGAVYSYHSGADERACSNGLNPFGHLASTQNSDGPYTIAVESSGGQPQYAASGTLKVTIQGSGTDPIKGFLIVAASPGDPTTHYGSFSVDGSGSTPAGNVQTRCAGKGLTQTATLHGSPPEKVELIWNAPSPAVGNIQFYATVVKSKTVFWEAIRSEVVWDGIGSPPSAGDPTTLAPVVDASISPVTEKGCGQSVSCWSNCENGACEHLLKWSVDPNDESKVNFELFASLGDEQYAAVGLATSASMIDVSMISCQRSNTGVSEVRQFHAVDQGSGVTQQNVGPIDSVQPEVAFSAGDKTMLCRFTYDNTLSTPAEWKDLDSNLYAFIARGPVTSVGSISQHTNIPTISPQSINFLQTAKAGFLDLGGSASFPFVKAHACIMVLAWVLCASIGVILARYYKPMWSSNKACGQKVWFSYHRALMLTCMGLTIVGLILILIETKGVFRTAADLPTKAHPILGLIAIICSLLNPLLAAFRCHPEDKKRPIFNWVHWFFGTVAHVFAIVAIFLGMLFDKAGVPGYTTYVMMGWCLFHVIVEFILEIHQCCMYDKNRDRTEEFQMTGKGDSQTPEPKYAGRRFKCGMIVLYLAVTILFTIALVVIIAVFK